MLANAHLVKYLERHNQKQDQYEPYQEDVLLIHEAEILTEADAQAVANYLRDHPEIHTLKLEHNDHTSEKRVGLVALCKQLESIDTIMVFKIKANNNSYLTEALVALFQNNVNITDINVSYLRGDDFVTLLQGLHHCAHISDISLAGYCDNKEQFAAATEFLHARKAPLSSFQLSGFSPRRDTQPKIGLSDFFTAIAAQLPALSVLCLNKIGLNSQDVELIQSLVTHPQQQFESFDIGNNNFSCYELEKIVSTFKGRAKALRSLSVYGSTPEESDIASIHGSAFKATGKGLARTCMSNPSCLTRVIEATTRAELNLKCFGLGANGVLSVKDMSIKDVQEYNLGLWIAITTPLLQLAEACPNLRHVAVMRSGTHDKTFEKLTNELTQVFTAHEMRASQSWNLAALTELFGYDGKKLFSQHPDVWLALSKRLQLANNRVDDLDSQTQFRDLKQAFPTFWSHLTEVPLGSATSTASVSCDL